MRTREDELRALAARLHERRDSKAFEVAIAARSARHLGLTFEQRSVAAALDAFEAAHQHASFAQDQVALEVYGCFWHRVTGEMITATITAVAS